MKWLSINKNDDNHFLNESFESLVSFIASYRNTRFLWNTMIQYESIHFDPLTLFNARGNYDAVFAYINILSLAFLFFFSTGVTQE